MISKNQLQDYNDALLNTLNHFNKYNKFFKVLSELSLTFGFIGLISLFIQLHILKAFSPFTVDSFMTSLSTSDCQMTGYISSGLLFLFVIFRFLDNKILKKQMENYQKHYLNQIMDNYSVIWHDRNLDSLKAETKKERLVSAFKEQQKNVSYVIDNYDYFNI